MGWVSGVVCKASHVIGEELHSSPLPLGFRVHLVRVDASLLETLYVRVNPLHLITYLKIFVLHRVAPLGWFQFVLQVLRIKA